MKRSGIGIALAVLLVVLLAACDGGATATPSPEATLPIITFEAPGEGDAASAPNPLEVPLSGPLTERPVSIGSEIESFDFSQPGTFEEGDYDPSGLFIRDGVYEIVAATGGFWWGQGGTIHTDAAVEAEVVRTDLTIARQALYGVMCRADPANTGDGYVFAIGPNGEVSIMRGEGDGYQDLFSARTEAVREGTNTVRGVCVGSYLALYVNDEFVVAVEDSTYTSGVPALVAGGAPNNVMTIAFDNLRVFNAAMAE
ncbi:MAG: hypothetical protein JW910_05270 [Anaerolineae bacterium]|nr:hypothetical protein [Anaerolineae bacterium]